MKQNDAAIAKWFTKTSDDDVDRYQWISPEVKDRFQALMEGYVSYVTLEHDPTVYPRFAARWEHRLPPDPSKGRILRYDSGTRTFQDTSATIHEPLVVVQVPSLKKHMSKEGTYKTAESEAGLYFRKFTEGGKIIEPIKWLAIIDTIRLHPEYKHFIFAPKKRETQLLDFGAYMHRNNMCRAISPAELSGLVLNDKKDKDITIEQHLNKLGPAERYHVMGTDAKKDETFLYLFNHRLNVDGRYVRYVLGGNAVKEGISLFATHFVHLVEPLKIGSMMNQVKRRVARFCSMANLDIKNWVITVVIYLAFQSRRETALMNRLSNMDNPVELAHQALIEGAFDCEMYKPLNKVKSCRAGSATNEEPPLTCYDLSDPSKDFPIRNASNMEECGRTGSGIVGHSGPYDAWDEVLLRLLRRNGHEPHPLPETVKVSKEARMTKTTTPKVLADVLAKEDVAVGNAVVMVLLAKKEKSRNTGSLDAKAELYIKMLDLDHRLIGMVDQKQKALRKSMHKSERGLNWYLEQATELDARASKLRSGVELVKSSRQTRIR